jgi:tRNA threonylcarbamoyladenosine biosynthesis protein TsaE
VNEAVYWHEEVTVATAAQMRALGWRLAQLLRAGDLVILSGPLGAGKTTLTQGIGDGLGVRGPVTSPTFVIARVHPPVKPEQGLTASGPALVHADAYRLGSTLEMDDLDLDADTETSVTVVEWGEGLAEDLAADRLEISIARGPAAAGPVAAAGPAGDTGPASPVEPDDAQSESDSPRVVTIVGVGERWQGIQLPPADLADRL